MPLTRPFPDTGLPVRLTEIERVFAAWRPGEPHFEQAVEQKTMHAGYPEGEVARQLAHVSTGVTARALRAILAREVVGRRRRPSRILHLASGAVPGLAIESLIRGLVTGATNVVRPSQDDYCTQPFVDLLGQVAPQLAELVRLTTDPVFHHVDAAIVYGSDATVRLVRERAAPGACIVAHGSKVGVAIVTAAALQSCDEWADELADDITRFDQRGCMCPRIVYVVGDADPAAMEQAIARAAAARPSAGNDEARRAAALRGRGDADLEMLAARRSSGTPPPQVAVHDAAGVVIRLLAGTQALADALGARRDLLQTCVLACSRKEWPLLERRVTVVGCSRVCAPGQAHTAPLGWPHDGLGFIAPLLRGMASTD